MNEDIMRRLAVAAFILGAISIAASAQTNSGNDNNGSRAPLTENQARARIEAAGFAAVSTLERRESGEWRGTAYRNGRKLKVEVSRRGSVRSE
jgi:hypothetical protein